MAKIFQDPRAVELCKGIRYLMDGNHVREGWTARPHHGKKLIQVGHSDYGVDFEITDQIDTVIHSLEVLGSAEAIGYKVALATY
jgi:hypothetical protein